MGVVFSYGIAIARSPSFLFLDDFERDANISAVIKSAYTYSSICVDRRIVPSLQEQASVFLYPVIRFRNVKLTPALRALICFFTSVPPTHKSFEIPGWGNFFLKRAICLLVCSASSLDGCGQSKITADVLEIVMMLNFTDVNINGNSHQKSLIFSANPWPLTPDPWLRKEFPISKQK